MPAEVRTDGGTPESALGPAAARLFDSHLRRIHSLTDRLFVQLLLAEWVFGILLALFLSPRAWEGSSSRVHLHVWVATLLGGAVISLPLYLASRRAGEALTRHVIAIAQMLYSALLIHLTGGRIETHFHVFGSLAFLAFYRDWRVLVTASLVVTADHYLRGVLWPRSVYGIPVQDPWRWMEHAGWVVFEVFFLILSCRRSVSEMRQIAGRRAEIEEASAELERRVLARTEELALSNGELSREIAVRTQAEEALRESEARYRLLFDSNPQPMWVFDRETLGFLAVNDTAVLQYGYSREEFLGMTIKDIRPGEDVPRLLNSMQGVSDGSPDWRHRRRDGTVFDVRIIADYITFGGRDAELIMAMDVSEQKRLEEHLRQAQKLDAIGQLAGGIAHDFNNLLTVMLGQAQLLHRQVQDHSAERRRVEEILMAGQRASGLTRQLLAFSRRQVLAPVILDLNDVLKESMTLAKRLIPEDIEVQVVPASESLRLKSDQGQVEQVILNLVINARDAIGTGGSIEVRADAVEVDAMYAAQHPGAGQGSYVRLSVTDNGCGMTAATRARIFEPFFTTKEVGKGTGLGLATVYGIVKQAEGFVSVYSELEHGTTFMVHFPRASEGMAARAGLPAPSDAEPVHDETILVVEDERSVRRLVVDMLAAHGYRVIEAAGGEEALLVARQHDGPIALVLSDIIMPGLGGREFAERFRAVRPEARTLFMSGYTDDAIVRHGVLTDRMAFIQKPFQAGALLQKVRDVITSDSRAA